MEELGEYLDAVITPEKARDCFENAPPSNGGTRTMFGEQRAMKTVSKIMDNARREPRSY